MPQSAFLAMLLAALALVAAGCGDDDDETTTTTTTSGATGATGDSDVASGELPADVVAEGNEICAQGNEELAEAFEGVGQNAKPEDFEQAVAEEVIPNIQEQIIDIRELDDSDDLQSTLDEAESILDEIKADPTLFTEAQGDPFAEVNDELTELGLNECAG